MEGLNCSARQVWDRNRINIAQRISGIGSRWATCQPVEEGSWDSLSLPRPLKSHFFHQVFVRTSIEMIPSS